MPIKPAGKYAIAIIIGVGGFFLLKPLIDKKKKTPAPIEVIQDSVTHDTVVPPTQDGVKTEPVKAPVKPQVKKPPVVKPTEPKKVVKPVQKKKGERENLDINF